MCVKERIAERIKRWREKEKEEGKENEFCKMMTLASVTGAYVCVCVCNLIQGIRTRMRCEVGLNGLMATGST